MGVCVDFILDHKLSDLSMAAVMRQFSALDSLFLEMVRFWSQWYPQFGPPLEPWQNIGAFNRGEPLYRAPAGFTLCSLARLTEMPPQAKRRCLLQDPLKLAKILEN